MKFFLPLFCILAISGLVTFANAASQNNSIQEQNKKIVIDFYELAFNQHQPEQAAKKYIGDHYIQHHPGVPDGAEAFYSYFAKYFKEHPESHVEIKRALADGDLVALHLHSRQNKADNGRAIVDLFRLENGKIVEHWDVIQNVPADAPDKMF